MKFSISQAEKILKSFNKDKIEFKIHALEKIEERNINREILLNTLKRNNIVSITYQEKNKYLFIFEFENKYDLKIVIKMKEKNNLEILSIFPEEKKRRLK